MQHGPTSTRPVQVSLTVEREEGLAVERRPQAQRLGSWCTVCIPTVGTGLVTQTKKKELVSEQRPQAQRLGSWCTVASLQLANVSSRRRRKGSPRIDAQKPNALDPGVQSHPSSWHVSHHADRGRACLVSTPTHKKKMEGRQPLLPYSLVFRLRLPRSAQRSGLRRSLRADSRRNLHVALHARARSAVPSLRPQYMGLLQTVVHIGQTLHSSISWVQSRALSFTSRT